jgi:hypothetical protein
MGVRIESPGATFDGVGPALLRTRSAEYIEVLRVVGTGKSQL